MSKVLLFTLGSAVLAVGVVLVGCSNQQSPQPASAPPADSQDQPAATDHEGHEDGESGHAEHSGHAARGKYADALAQLSPEDCALAEKQKTCPVSGEPLGKMGKPHKVTVNGQGVLLCCPGCEAKFKKNPEEYLAKLKP